jgi:hypothetical protein
MNNTSKGRDEHVPNETELFVAGQDAAAKFLHRLERFIPKGDELFTELLIISKSGDFARLRGFARSLQKSMEGRQ